MVKRGSEQLLSTCIGMFSHIQTHIQTYRHTYIHTYMPGPLKCSGFLAWVKNKDSSSGARDASTVKDCSRSQRSPKVGIWPLSNSNPWKRKNTSLYHPRFMYIYIYIKNHPKSIFQFSGAYCTRSFGGSIIVGRSPWPVSSAAMLPGSAPRQSLSKEVEWGPRDRPKKMIGI